MRRIALLIVAILLLTSSPTRAWDRACLTSQGVFVDGTYYREIRIPSVATNWTYTAVPPVEMTIHTFRDIPITVVITVSVDPLITDTLHTITTVYTDIVQPIGFQSYVVRDSDLGLIFRSPAPFTLYHCVPGMQPHTFLPLVHRASVGAVVTRVPVDRGSNIVTVTKEADVIRTRHQAK